MDRCDRGCGRGETRVTSAVKKKEISRTCRENLVLRCALDPHDVSAIPNAVDALQFTPRPEGELENEGR